MFGAPDFYFNYIQWFDCDQVTQRLSAEVVTRSKETTIKKKGTRDSLLDREYRQMALVIRSQSSREAETCFIQ